MNEALFDLFDLTGNEGYRATGALFNHFQWTAPLALGTSSMVLNLSSLIHSNP